MQKLEKLAELRAKETEILQHLDMLDIIFNSDCTQDGVPLTKTQYENLWKENAEWENELLRIRLKIYFLANPLPPMAPKKKKQQLCTHINTATDGGCETDLHHKKNSGIER